MKLKIDCEKKLPLKKLAKVVMKHLNQKERCYIELVFVGEEEIRSLNAQNRGVDKVTDVLSFPTLDGIRGKILTKKDFPLDTQNGRLNLGSIAVCEEQCARQAQEIGHSTEREIIYLVLHGVLHLFGYDHLTDDDKTQMRNIEKAVLATLKIDQGE